MLLFAAGLVTCTNKKEGNKTEDIAGTEEKSSPVEMPKPAADNIMTPTGYKKLGQATGDLDKDGQAEQVIVFDTERNGEMGTERDIQIFRNTDDAWELWHTSIGAVLPSEGGGMMGDPFQEVNIENGCIVFSHFGGSRQKWNYIHRFRFQNGTWQLIGATMNYGAPCDSWENLDFNLSTGKINYEKETENCEDGEENRKTVKESKEFSHKLPALPNMDGFIPGENELKLTGMENIFYY